MFQPGLESPRYLANDMEEDLEGPKCEIFPWALGKDWCLRVGKFLHQRDKLWARMGFRAVVSRQCCEEVMAKEPFHWAWTRDRRPHHGGVQRVCPQVPVHLPRGPGLSPPHCSPCGLPQHCSRHQLKPVSSKCPSLTSECHRPPSQNYLSRVKNTWGGDFLIVLPPQMQLEPGTYSLRSECRMGQQLQGWCGSLGGRSEDQQYERECCGPGIDVLPFLCELGRFPL
nr:speedy protein C isoform X3 [Macaca nemestrina]